MEIEIRAKIPDLPAFLRKLNGLPEVKAEKSGVHEVDTYLKHGQDKERILVLRIRRRPTGAILTFKTKSQGKDVAWHDIDLPLHDPDMLEDILLNSGYVYVVLIDKVRDAFRRGAIEINVDQIRELGNFVEVAFETSGSATPQQIRTKTAELKQLLAELGCGQGDIVEKGYVKLMEELKGKA